MERLAKRMEDSAGETLFYTPAGEEQPRKTLGWKGAEGTDVGEGEVPVDAEEQDFLFAAWRLERIGVTPGKDDFIRDSEGRIYRVVPDSFDRHFRHSDSTRKIVRVHTQLEADVD